MASSMARPRDGTGPDTLLRARGLSLDRGRGPLFANIDVDLTAGTAIRLIGANGTGKTSLLRILAGLLPPNAGSVERHAPIGWVGHENALDPTRSVAANLAFWRPARDRHRPDPLGIEPLMTVPVRSLSQGQKRRVALTRLLNADKRVWLLDEPVVGLDDASRDAFRTCLTTHIGNGGAAIVATHGETWMAGAETLSLGGGQNA